MPTRVESGNEYLGRGVSEGAIGLYPDSRCLDLAMRIQMRRRFQCTGPFSPLRLLHDILVFVYFLFLRILVLPMYSQQSDRPGLQLCRKRAVQF